MFTSSTVRFVEERTDSERETIRRIDQVQDPLIWDRLIAAIRAGRNFVIRASGCAVGRDTANDIVPNDASVSRVHCRIYRQTDRYLLSDMGSRNGTFLNGAQVEGPTVLNNGDILYVGHTKYIFLYDQWIDAALIELTSPADGSTATQQTGQQLEVGAQTTEMRVRDMSHVRLLTTKLEPVAGAADEPKTTEDETQSSDTTELYSQLYALDEQCRKKRLQIRVQTERSRLIRGLEGNIQNNLVDSCERLLELLGWVVIREGTDARRLCVMDRGQVDASVYIAASATDALEWMLPPNDLHVDQLSVPRKRFIIFRKLSQQFDTDDEYGQTGRDLLSKSIERQVCVFSAWQLLYLYNSAVVNDFKTDEIRAQILSHSGKLPI